MISDVEWEKRKPEFIAANEFLDSVNAEQERFCVKDDCIVRGLWHIDDPEPPRRLLTDRCLNCNTTRANVRYNGQVCATGYFDQDNEWYETQSWPRHRWRA